MSIVEIVDGVEVTITAKNGMYTGKFTFGNTGFVLCGEPSIDSVILSAQIQITLEKKYQAKNPPLKFGESGSDKDRYSSTCGRDLTPDPDCSRFITAAYE